MNEIAIFYTTAPSAKPYMSILEINLGFCETALETIIG